MASRREQVIVAARALLAAAVPTAEVLRNAAKPERVPAGGLIIVRDGDPGEPAVTLSPASYLYAHRIAVDVVVGGSAREGALDAMLRTIGVAIAADRTLGGLCDWIEAEAPAPDDAETFGASPVRMAALTIVAHYATADPLG